MKNDVRLNGPPTNKPENVIVLRAVNRHTIQI